MSDWPSRTPFEDGLRPSSNTVWGTVPLFLLRGGTGFYHPANFAERVALSSVIRGGFKSSFEHGSGHGVIAIVSYMIRRGTNEGLFSIVRGATGPLEHNLFKLCDMIFNEFHVCINSSFYIALFGRACTIAFIGAECGHLRGYLLGFINTTNFVVQICNVGGSNNA